MQRYYSSSLAVSSIRRLLSLWTISLGRLLSVFSVHCRNFISHDILSRPRPLFRQICPALSFVASAYFSLFMTCAKNPVFPSLTVFNIFSHALYNYFIHNVINPRFSQQVSAPPKFERLQTLYGSFIELHPRRIAELRKRMT